MRFLIKREYKRDIRDCINSGIVLSLISVAVMLLYFLLKEEVVTLGSRIFKLPEPAYRILGFNNAIHSYNLAFLNGITVTIANIFIIIKACDRVYEIVDRDEINGTIFFMCNQLYSRREYIIGKYLWSVIRYSVEYVWFYAVIILTGYFTDIKGLQAGEYFGSNLKLMVAGICIGVMYISIVYVYAVYRNRKDDSGSYFLVRMITWGIVLLANLYRVVDLLKWIMKAYNMSQVEILERLSGFEMLKYFSPLTWINPFNKFQVMSWGMTCLIGVLISVLCLGVTVFLYERRDIS